MRHGFDKKQQRKTSIATVDRFDRRWRRVLDKHHAAFFEMTKRPVAIGGDESGVGGHDKILDACYSVQSTLLCYAGPF